jgi:ApbE superfamily uncharacterized protein (UPF0280 family)
VANQRTYRNFTHREAVFRICCDAFDAVTAEIVHQRQVLERYIERHPEFRSAFEPIDARDDSPESAKRMAAAAHLVGTGPMAAVAGTMAQLAGEAALRSRAAEVIVENGGDIYLSTTEPTRIALHTGTEKLASRLAFAVEPGDTPLAICSSSGKMGHSTSLGRCDLATVIARSAALADAAATMAANLVEKVDDVDAALNRIVAIEGIDGILIVQEDRIGLAGNLPELVKTQS